MSSYMMQQFHRQKAYIPMNTYILQSLEKAQPGQLKTIDTLEKVYYKTVITQEELDRWYDGIDFSTRMLMIKPEGGFVLFSVEDGKGTYSRFSPIQIAPSIGVFSVQ